MTKVLVSLVGHQPLPNLLALRYEQPDIVMFLYSSSKDPVFLRRKSYLETLAQRAGVKIVYASSPVDPWNIDSVPDLLNYDLMRFHAKSTEVIFDLTGGTKAMSIGLSRAAAQFLATMVYIESEGKESFLRRYRLNSQGALISDEPEPLPPLVSVDDFFYVHLGLTDTSPHINPKATPHSVAFEEAVRTLFASLCDEMKYSVIPIQNEEVDIILRKGNRFAIVECKSVDSKSSGTKARSIEGILQLNHLANDKHLGSYTQKILAVELDYRGESGNNAKVADEHDVHLLELPDWEEGQPWTNEQIRRAKQVVNQVFG